MSKNYIIHSIPDNQNFLVPQKIIDASVLLKNLCELTDINEPIDINCSAACLNFYINLINDYDDIIITSDIAKYYEKYFNSDDDYLMKIVKNMCILDSDIFLNFIADYILWKLKDKKWDELKDFFELEDDFTFEERVYIENHLLEYILSFDMKDVGLEFPFKSCSKFITLKNRYYTPMNVLLGRIIEISDNKISFELSLINKTIKNEYDRYPLKAVEFQTSHNWVLKISCEKNRFHLKVANYDIKYFNKIKERKVIVYSVHIIRTLHYQYYGENAVTGWSRATSLDFVIPRNNQQRLEIEFWKNIKMVDYFDTEKCLFSFIWLRFYYMNVILDFKSIFEKYVNFSREIWIDARKSLGFYEEEDLIRIKKKAGAEKFYEIQLFHGKEKIIVFKNFKDFVANFMEDAGVVICCNIIAGIPEKFVKEKNYCIYSVEFLKENL